MSTSTMQIAHHYRIYDADWRTGHVTIDSDVQGSEPTRLPVGDLREAGLFGAPALRPLYDELYRRAIVAVDDARQESVSRCLAHAAIGNTEHCFRGPVIRDENRAAHGGILRIETCRCGAERHTNVNGGHIEQGEWI